ncbi:MAG: carboxypeptidase-like regulatory domain-containing protein, partial [Candidatus Brocadiales bacterium]
GAGWAGPYITPILREDLGDILKDPFGNTYSYTTTAYQRAIDNEWVSARIRSFGSNKTDDGGAGDDKQVEILRREILSTVIGRVTDSAGTGIPGATVTLYYPSGGSVSNTSITTGAGGSFSFTNVPYGVRTITATASPVGNLQYAGGSALAIDGNNLSFNVTNWGTTAVTVTSITLSYTFAPTGYYEEAYAGGAKIFEYDNPSVPNYNEGNRRGNGDTLIISPSISVPGGSGASTTVRILVASDNVQLPDIILSPAGGGTLNFRYLNFMRNPSGGGPKADVDNEQFTVTLNDGDTVVLTASFTAEEQEED